MKHRSDKSQTDYRGLSSKMPGVGGGNQQDSAGRGKPQTHSDPYGTKDIITTHFDSRTKLKSSADVLAGSPGAVTHPRVNSYDPESGRSSCFSEARSQLPNARNWPKDDPSQRRPPTTPGRGEGEEAQSGRKMREP
jgi:hypothetical protein